MRIISLLPSLILLLLDSTPSRGHGYLRTPPARNVLANSDYCPHCLNFGTVNSVSDNGQLHWPEGLRGICGDAYNGPRDHEWGGKYYGDGTPVASYSRGGIAEIDIFVSTNHNGGFRFRVCKVRKGPFEPPENEQLTEECLDEHVLKQANIPEAQTPGEEWFYTIPSDPSTVQYTMYYQLPEDLVCDGEESACVLQWYWVSANSCNPPAIPEQYKRPYNLADCTSPSAPYPEEFVNCADIAVIDTKSGAAQYALKPFSDPLVNPPIVLYSSDKSPRFIDPTSNEELEDASRVVRPDKSLVEKAAARSFCRQKSSYGKYPNPVSCKSYFLCRPADSWFFECPFGTAYDPSKERCALSTSHC